MGGDPSIIAIAKYAKQAQDAMRVTKATQAEIAKQATCPVLIIVCMTF